jgi:hypothetical protein
MTVAPNIGVQVYLFIFKYRCRDSSVGIATGYGLDDRVVESRWGQDFLLLHVVQTGSRAHPASYQMDTAGGKAAGA